MQHHVTVLVPTEQTLTMAVQRETIPHLVLGPLNHAIMFFIFGIAQGIKEPLEPIHPADILRRRIPSPIPKLRIRNVHAAVGTQKLNIMDPIVTIILVIASGTHLGKHVAQLGFRSNANFRQRLHRHILFVFRLMV